MKLLAVNCQEQCENPAETMWFRLLPAMFLESLPAAPQPLMAPWAHIAVLTLAKSQPPPACKKLRRFSTTVKQMILAHIMSNKKDILLSVLNVVFMLPDPTACQR